MRILAALLVALSPLVLLAEENLFCETFEGEILKYIEERNVCVSDSECTTYTRCPFGCYRPLSQSTAGKVESMFNAYDELCDRCLYECMAKGHRDNRGSPPAVKCISNKCRWTDEAE